MSIIYRNQNCGTFLGLYEEHKYEFLPEKPNYIFKVLSDYLRKEEKTDKLEMVMLHLVYIFLQIETIMHIIMIKFVKASLISLFVDINCKVVYFPTVVHLEFCSGRGLN